MTKEKIYHIPIMLKEVVSNLIRKPDSIVIDGTIGFGGHAAEILAGLKFPGQLIGFDADPKVVEYTKKKLSLYQQSSLFSIWNCNYKEFPTVLNTLGINKVDAIILDLGVSSYNLDEPDRGFSYRTTGPLDMRFNQNSGKTAKELLALSTELELCEILHKYSDVIRRKQIARAITKRIEMNQMNTTFDLKEAVSSVIWGKKLNKMLSQVYQAFRIWVNDELEALKTTLELSNQYLNASGRIGIISFHSIEDRIVKHYFKEESRTCVCPKMVPKCICDHKQALRVITKKPIVPSSEELNMNSRASSAKFRVAEKI